MTEYEDPRLTVVCTDGTTIGCTNFEAKRSGILLTDDLKRNRVFGFVAHDEVRFILPTEAALDALANAAEATDPLTRIPGIGSTYAARLREAGYSSTDDIADADPTDLAEVTGASETKATQWVERAGGGDELRVE